MRLTNLDILRSIAILLVIGVHTTQAFPTTIEQINQVGYLGRFGVQLFFLVSAFTMCLMWDARANERDRVYRFFVRRFVRIVPLYLLFIPIYIFAFGVHPDHWHPNGIDLKSVITNITLTHSLWPDTIGGIVHGGWSISVEALFYLVFPVLAISVLRLNPILTSLLAATAFSIASISYRTLFSIFSNYYQSLDSNLIDDFLYLNIFNQLFVFLLGMALYQSRERGLTIRIALSISPVLCAAPLFTFGLITGKSLGFSIVVFGLSVIFIAVSTLAQKIPDKGMALASLKAIGKRSYGIYIVHFLIIAALSEIVPDQLGRNAMLPFAYLVTVLASYFVAQHLEDAITTATAPVKRKLLKQPSI